jgi:hypothetical protein
MSRRFQVLIEVEMPDQATEHEAGEWGAALLSVLESKNQRTPHPYNPRVVGAIEVARANLANRVPS